MSRGQAINGAIIAVALLSSGVTWVGNYVLNSPAKSAEAVKMVETELGNTNQRLSSLEAKNDNLEKWLSRIEAKLDKTLNNK